MADIYMWNTHLVKFQLLRSINQPGFYSLVLTVDKGANAWVCLICSTSWPWHLIRLLPLYILCGNMYTFYKYDEFHYDHNEKLCVLTQLDTHCTAIRMKWTNHKDVSNSVNGRRMKSHRDLYCICDSLVRLKSSTWLVAVCLEQKLNLPYRVRYFRGKYCPKIVDGMVRYQCIILSVVLRNISPNLRGNKRRPWSVIVIFE